MTYLWQDIQSIDSELICQAREQLHQAAQIAAAVGRTYNDKVKDDHFANFSYNQDLQLLQGNAVEGDVVLNCGLHLRDLALVLIEAGGDELDRLPLHGKTQKQALVWLEEQLLRQGLDGTQLSVQPPYEIPAYDTAKGKEFEIEAPEAFTLLSQMFSNTQLLLKQQVNHWQGASEIKCWPHHLDLATLVTLNDTGNAETSTSIGAGLSPGDESYNEPYFYLAPWPYPPVTDLVEFSGPGSWHTDGWVGGVLTLTDLLADGQNQQMLVDQFLREGVDHLQQLLGYHD